MYICMYVHICMYVYKYTPAHTHTNTHAARRRRKRMGGDTGETRDSDDEPEVLDLLALLVQRY